MTNTAGMTLDEIAGTVTTTTAPVEKKAEMPVFKNKEDNQLKSLVLSIVQSLQLMDEEKANIKEIQTKIKEEYDIAPKIAKRTAMLIHKNDKLEFDKTQELIDDLYFKLAQK